MFASLPSLFPFLEIYDIDANCQNFSESFNLSIENRMKAQYKFSFIGFYTNGSKSTKYQSYIKPNNHYWVKVSVTKNTPFELLREIPWEISFPSLLLYFCLPATAVQSITKEQKQKLKAKKPKKIKMSIEMLKNLQVRQVFSFSENVSWLDALDMAAEKEDYLIGHPNIPLI